ncbi:MAG: glycosyltransferase family 2 protein [Paracoccaceae bacterium]|nr:glycosyltransferase family 2 protein [Paracoccaceae bacterium]
MDTWGVAALVDEPAALVAAFVAYHLDLGASEVHILLDRPNPEAQDLLAGVPGAFLHQAGEDGWAFNGVNKAPPRHLGRQKYHASRILAETSLDWIVHCDADEFILPLGGETVAGVLTPVRKGASWAKIHVAERVHCGDLPAPHLFTGAFRNRWPEFASEGGEVYDDITRALLNYGLCGHQLGKSATRSGRDLFIGVHRPMREYGGGGNDVPHDGLSQMQLLHFDGITQLHYTLKMIRRAINARAKAPPKHSPARQLQFSVLAEGANDPAMTSALFYAAKVISEQQADLLEDKGVLSWYDHRIPARVERVLGAGAVDLSPAAFDRALLTHEAWLIAKAQELYGFDPEPLMVC